jgi:hypothetical protein
MRSLYILTPLRQFLEAASSFFVLYRSTAMSSQMRLRDRAILLVRTIVLCADSTALSSKPHPVASLRDIVSATGIPNRGNPAILP